MIRWTGLAPWEFEFPFPGSLTTTFLELLQGRAPPCVEIVPDAGNNGSNFQIGSPYTVTESFESYSHNFSVPQGAF